MQEKKILKVGIREYSPLLYKKGETWDGFEVKLWQKIAENLNLDFVFYEESNLNELLKKTESAQYDLSFGGISRSRERGEKLEMSYFTLDTGLGIAVLPTTFFSAKDLLKKIFCKQTFVIVFILFLYVFFVANIYWFLERGLSVEKDYSSGFFHSLWWAIVTFSTVGYGDISPQTVAAKIFGIFSIFLGLGIFALYMGQISSALTLAKLRSKISSQDDLVGKRVGVRKNSLAKSYVQTLTKKIFEHDTLDEAYRDLSVGKLDAIIADLPLLQDKRREYDFNIVGGLLSRQTYAFVLPKNQDNKKLLKDIDLQIVYLQQSGYYDFLYRKYFKD